MTVSHPAERVTLHHGDALTVLRDLPTNSVDAVITDPPYSLSFMGRAWDTHESPAAFQAWCAEWAAECLRVVKPGGFLASFGGTRTYHRLASGIEDAGWQPWDSVGVATYAWCHGQGFPKGKSQLKPAWEPIVLARKASKRVGLLNIDACRIAHGADVDLGAVQRQSAENPLYVGGAKPGDKVSMYKPGGRWPTNVVLAHHPDCVEVGTREVRTGTAVNRNRADGTYQAPSCYGEFATKAGADVTYGTNGRETIPAFDCHPDCQVAALDEQSEGTRAAKPSGTHVRHSTTSRGLYREKRDGEGTDTTGHDGSGASRFFPTFRYQAKAPKSERPMVDGKGHPTVKPLGLMRWLVRLLVPEEACVLDPFAGSGATLEAARLEGRPAIGIERDAHAIALIHERFRTSTPPATPADEPADEAVELTLFG